MNEITLDTLKFNLDTVRFVLTHWILHVFVVVFVTLVMAAILRRVMDTLQERAEATTSTLWDDAIVKAVRRPLGAVVWIVGLAFAMEIVGRETGAAIFQAIPTLRELAVIATIIWFLTLLIREGEDAYLHKGEFVGKSVDPGTVNTIGKLIRLSVIITGALVALQTMGFSISGLLAFGGIGGIAVGFAAKDVLANFLGGLMIHLDRPFQVGDWVLSPDREIEGVVEDISWRLTRIRTFDKRPLYIPNAAFSTITVINPSRMSHRRIYETIGIRYDDVGKMREIVEDVREMLLAHPEIDTSQTMIVHFNSFAPSSVDFFVYTFTRTTEWVKFHAVKEDVLLKIVDIIESHQAEIAFPTSTIHLAKPLPPGVEE